MNIVVERLIEAQKLYREIEKRYTYDTRFTFRPEISGLQIEMYVSKSQDSKYHIERIVTWQTLESAEINPFIKIIEDLLETRRRL